MTELVIPGDRRQLDKIRKAAEEELARKSLIHFAARTESNQAEPYMVTPMHVLLAGFLELMDARVTPNLLVELPPQHGKSRLVTVCYGAWRLGRHPKHDVVSVSYGDDLAWDLSADCREKLRQDTWPFPDVKVSGSNWAKSHWMTNHGGSYRAAGRDTSITGRPANHVNIDDLLKNRDEAESATIREACWKMWTTTASTRLHREGTACVTATRWHDDDLLGRLKSKSKQGGRQWTVITMPALSDSNLVYATVDVPDHIARHAGLTEAEDVGSILGKLKATLGPDHV